MHILPWEIRQPYYEALGLMYNEDLGMSWEEYNPAQFAAIKAGDRFPLIIGGERAGKSWVSAAIMLPHIDLLPEIRRERFYYPDDHPDMSKAGKLKYDPKTQRPVAPDFVLFGPNYAEPRIEFGYIENWLRELDNIQTISKPQEGAWRLVTKQGVVLSTWSTDDPASIRAIDLEGAIACEAGNMELESIYRLQGRVGAKKGFIIYSGTMEMAKRWYIQWAQEGERPNNKGVKTYHIPSWANLSQFPLGRDDPEIKRWETIYPEDIFLTRVAAQPVPPRDRVIREIKEEHIRKVKLPRNEDGSYACKFDIAIDPGYLPSAYAVLWVASWDTPDGKFWYVFDELYEQEIQNETVIDYIKRHKFYKYLDQDSLTIDTSAKRHADGNEPAIEKFRRLTKLKSPYTHYWHEKALIDRIRITGKQGLIAIHPNCTGLIAELGLGEEVFPEMHAWKYQTDRSGTIVSEKPKDAWNHSCKALGYLLLRYLRQVEILEKPKGYNRIKKRTGSNVPRRSIFNWKKKDIDS